MFETRGRTERSRTSLRRRLTGSGLAERCRQMWHAGVNLLLPPTCAFCGVDIEPCGHEPLLCGDCVERLAPNVRLVCGRCGMLRGVLEPDAEFSPAPASPLASPPAVDTGASVLFFATDERTLMEMRYSFAEDAHVAVDRSVLARHLTEAASVRSAAWQAWPDGVLWIALDDGSLVSFTYLPEHAVFAFDDDRQLRIRLLIRMRMCQVDVPRMRCGHK